jgi:YVTN family beta-propeller protein
MNHFFLVPALNLLTACLAIVAALVGSSVAAADKPSTPIFVLNSLDASISVIDPGSFTELRRIPTGKEPHHLYPTPDGKSLIVANALGDSLTLVDPRSGDVQRTITPVSNPNQLRFSPDMKWLAVAASRLDRVDIYRWQPDDAAAPLKLAGGVRAARTPSHLAIDSKSTTVYATLQDSDELVAIDLLTRKPRWKIATGRLPADVYLTPDDRLLLVALTGDDQVEVYDVSQPTPKRIKRVQTGAGAHMFRARGDGRHVFVGNRVANTVSLIDTQSLSVVASYPAPGGPDGIELMADGKTLLVSARWANKLSVIDIDKMQLVRQVDVGRSPHGVWTLDHAERR